MNSNQLNEWSINYKKYIEFQCACLINAYEYGGMKFSKYQFPTFAEFCEVLGDKRYDYTQVFFTEHWLKLWSYSEYCQRSNFHNNTNQPLRHDYANRAIYYSIFRGIKWNYKTTDLPFTNF